MFHRYFLGTQAPGYTGTRGRRMNTTQDVGPPHNNHSSLFVCRKQCLSTRLEASVNDMVTIIVGGMVTDQKVRDARQTITTYPLKSFAILEQP